jgi:hypothetical protein
MGGGPLGFLSPTVHTLGSLDVTVTDADVSDLTFDPAPLSSLSGQVEFTGDSKKLTDASERRGISLYNATNQQQLSATLAADGSFSFPVADPGTYVLRFAPDLLRNGQVYATSASLDGAPIQEGKVTVLPQMSHQIKVVLDTGTGQLLTDVIPSDLPRVPYSDEPCRERVFGGIISSRVFLIPDVPFPLGASANGAPVFGGNSQGPEHPLRFETYLLPPGRYHVVASEYAGFNVPWLRQDAKLTQDVAALGQPVEIKAGETANVTIRNTTVEIQAVRARDGDPLGRDDY